jgi:IPT/TIG domain-containing protein
LAGGTTLGLVSVAGLAAGPVSQAGADTAPYTLSCTLSGNALQIPGAVTTGSLPGSVTPGKSFTLSNYSLGITLPASLGTAAGGHTVKGHYTTSVTASGATPTSQATTLTVPLTSLPKPATGVKLTAQGSPVNFTAGSAGGAASVSTSTSGTLVITVTFTGHFQPISLKCTASSAVTIASTTISAPQTSVAAVLPNSGPLAGGNTVTVVGTFLTGAGIVAFGGTPGTSISVKTANLLTVVAPPGNAGTVDVQVATPAGKSPLGPADHYTYTNAPIVTGVNPGQGAPAGGTSVTITGLQMTAITGVSFGSTPAASFTQNSSTQITAVSPPGTGTVDIILTNAQGTSVPGLLDQFSYTSPGYWEVASDGGIFAFGGAPFYGSMGGKPLNQPIVGIASTLTGTGYWEVASDGGLFAFGDAGFHGSMGGKPLNKPIVGMAPTPTGGGYWEVASDGGLFAFGNAPFYGSMGGKKISAPIVQMIAAPTGTGYWEIASDGTVYSFGFAGHYGGMGGKALNKPIVAGAATPTFDGNWQVASDGGIFAFGTAGYYGSMGGQPLNKPIVGMATTLDGAGYWLVASDGGIFSFGDAVFSGSMGGKPLNAPVVGIAAA